MNSSTLLPQPPWLSRAKGVAYLWLLNFFLFLVGFNLAWFGGELVPKERRDLPFVIANRGEYRQLSEPAFVYVRLHKVATGTLSAMLVPALAYIGYSKLVA